MVKWRARILWFTAGYLVGIAVTVANAVRLGYIPW
jgi:hypothetical protein